MKFELGHNFSLTIDGVERYFAPMEHPAAPDLVHAMEGGKGTVYRLEEQATASQYAFKVMKSRHRTPDLVEICGFLDRLKKRPGLTVCERLCLDDKRAPHTVGDFRNLSYSILMPWIQGASWFDLLYKGKQGQFFLTREQSLQLAVNFARIIAALEESQLAHCDLSAGNIMVDTANMDIELIDVEDLFSSGAPQPKSLPLGTPGYQHRTSHQGQWNTYADRFSGAILVSEMLGWWDEEVRTASFGESYFDPDELQGSNSQRLGILLAALGQHDSEYAQLLERAWFSSTLDECPALREWLDPTRIRVDWEPIRLHKAVSKASSVFEPFWSNQQVTRKSSSKWEPASTTSSPSVTWE